MFLLINMSIVPFTISANEAMVHQFFLANIITSMILCIVLMTNHTFDEDAIDGTLDQYHVFGLPIYVIYLSKVIAASVEFILIISAAFICAALLYDIDAKLILWIWICAALTTPLLLSVGVFGSMLTINLKKNSTISVLLVFPLLMSALILLCLAVNDILLTKNFEAAKSYVEINIGLTILLTPILSLLVKYLR